MITRLLIRALQLVDVTLALWARGLLGTANGGVTVLVERVSQDDDTPRVAANKSAVDLSNVIVLRVSGREEKDTITYRSSSLSLISQAD